MQKETTVNDIVLNLFREADAEWESKRHEKEYVFDVINDASLLVRPSARIETLILMGSSQNALNVKIFKLANCRDSTNILVNYEFEKITKNSVQFKYKGTT